jgi:predicted metal-dependent hydrolase
LRIDPFAGHVIVTLPKRTARQEGLALLNVHADWVAARLAALPPAVTFSEGAVIAINGRQVRIRRESCASGAPRWLGHELWVGGAPDEVRTQVAAFLQSAARVRFAGLAATKSVRIGVWPRRIVLKDMRSRWGSCTKDRTLAFSWRLIMAPDFVQDHVVAHEVAHLRHMNHGAQFRALERELSLSAEPARAWLWRYGAGLLRVG